MKSYDVAVCGCPLKLFERPTPTPTGSEVLLRVLAAGVCHSDVHFWEGVYDLGGGKQLKLTDRGMKLPLTMGHENVGEVAALGPEAKGVRIGERRLVYPWIGCGQCMVCRRGEENLCLKPGFIGVHRPGGYSDHLLVPHPRYLFDIGDLAPEVAAPYACSGLTTYGALKKLGTTPKDMPILVIGAGGLGLMCLSLLKGIGGKGAVVVDIDPAKRDAAKKAGALAVVDGRAGDAAAQVKAHFPEGVWGAIDLVGAAETVKLGIDCLTKGGKLVVCGLFGGELALPTLYIPMRALNIQGSYVGTPGEMKELLELVQRVHPPVIPITRRPLAEAFQCIEALKSGTQLGRAVLTP